jgi:hypothetical protein
MNELTSAQTQVTTGGSIVGRVTTLRVERYGVLMQAGTRNFFILQNTQTDYERTPPPNLLFNGYRSFSPAGKAAGAWR